MDSASDWTESSLRLDFLGRARCDSAADGSEPRLRRSPSHGARRAGRRAGGADTRGGLRRRPVPPRDRRGGRAGRTGRGHRHQQRSDPSRRDPAKAWRTSRPAWATCSPLTIPTSISTRRSRSRCSSTCRTSTPLSPRSPGSRGRAAGSCTWRRTGDRSTGRADDELTEPSPPRLGGPRGAPEPPGHPPSAARRFDAVHQTPVTIMNPRFHPNTFSTELPA